MPAKKTATARKRPASKTITPRARAGPRPQHHSLSERAARWLGRTVAHHAARRRTAIRSRKDAAILRATHQGCATCGGNGQIFTKKKDGTFSGSNPCPAKPATTKVSKWQAHKAARFGPDKHSGLIGWRCPCGKREKPHYRDAKTATRALRAHEQKAHGGSSVGGAWYAQISAPKSVTAKGHQVSKIVTNSGMTDEQWIKQNGRMHPDQARAKGLCWQCSGKGTLYSAFGGQQLATVCPECTGTGKAKP